MTALRGGAALAALLALVAGAPAAARPSGAVDLDPISEAIRAGDWSAAVAACDAAVEESLERGDRRPVEAAHFADLLTRCAIAAGGGGDAEDSSWYWHAANVLDPPNAVERARELAGEVRLPPIRESPPRRGEARLRSLDGSPFAGDTAQPIESPSPRIPPRRAQPLTIAIEHVIGEDGRTREPLFVESTNCGPFQAFAVLLAQRDWRFEPARVDGRPAAVLYVLTVRLSRS